MKRTLIVVIAFGIISATGALLDRALFWRSEVYVLSTSPTEYDATALPRGYVPVSVLFIGDSQIAKFPIPIFIDDRYQCHNMGHGGDTIDQIFHRLKAVSDLSRYDVIVVEGGTNDIIHCVQASIPFEQWVQQLTRHYAQVFKQVGEKPVVVMNIPPVTNRFLLTSLRTGAYPNFFDVDEANQVITASNDVLRECCRQNNVVYFDLYGLLTDGNDELSKEYACPDGYHINPFGYRMIARNLVNVLGQLKNHPSRSL